ncbi:MAG TPA: methyltransferase domain-containing protein [Acidimicrobiales bacterium]|nr:methyltransferase domain-containing protein [Acidimicrobiales bacterium]
MTEENRAYLAQVMIEIDDEVRRRRATGDLPVRIERELDELFLEHSPVAGRGGGLGEALRMVDAAAFIDPVVPVGSNKSGGAAVKKGLRSLNLWYIGYVTHQVSQFASAVSRSLHLLDDRVADLRRQLDAQRVPPTPVIEVPAAVGPEAWWVPQARKALAGAPGRVLHAACGDGWLVQALAGDGVDAYGVDPRPGKVDEAPGDLREEPVAEHLRAVESAALGGVVLSGVLDGAAHGERQQLLGLLDDRLAPGGTLVVHSVSPAGWDADDAPAEADLAPGRPLRPATWTHLLTPLGYSVTLHQGPSAADYLVVAVLDNLR